MSGPETEVLVGAGVLAGWILLIYLGLAWFWQMRRRNPPGGAGR
jgi:hypothetical protein